MRELLQQALKHIQNFKSDWMRVPPFADKVNKATRFAISNAHGSIFQLEQDLIAELAKPEQAYDHASDAMSVFADVNADLIQDAKPDATFIDEGTKPEQYTLICETCGADRTKEDCKGERLQCDVMGQSQVVNPDMSTKQQNVNTSEERVHKSGESIHEMQRLGQELEQEPFAYDGPALYADQTEQSSGMDEWRSMIVVNLLRRCPDLSKHDLRELAAHFESRLPTAATRKEWVGLTDDEQIAIASTPNKSRHWIVWETESKLRSKNVA